jgi:hypothetical protein
MGLNPLTKGLPQLRAGWWTLEPVYFLGCGRVTPNTGPLATFWSMSKK